MSGLTEGQVKQKLNVFGNEVKKLGSLKDGIESVYSINIEDIKFNTTLEFWRTTTRFWFCKIHIDGKVFKTERVRELSKCIEKGREIIFVLGQQLCEYASIVKKNMEET